MRIGGLEAGGTKMVLGLGDGCGNIFERSEIPTEHPEVCLPKIVNWFKERGIESLGVGSFGPTCVNPSDERFGTILDTPKLDWKNYEFRKALIDGLNVPVGYDTDVNAACLGESVYGAGKNVDSLVYITVGTGIGAGVMVDGNLLHGMLHPEAGHILIDVNSDNGINSVCPYHQNCLESLASGPAIERRWGVRAEALAEKAEVWELESEYLSKAIATYILCYSPKRIILGGGVMKQTQLFDLIREKVNLYLGGYINTPEIRNMEEYIMPAGCNGNQGLLGSIELGKKALKI